MKRYSSALQLSTSYFSRRKQRLAPNTSTSKHAVCFTTTTLLQSIKFDPAVANKNKSKNKNNSMDNDKYTKHMVQPKDLLNSEVRKLLQQVRSNDKADGSTEREDALSELKESWKGNGIAALTLKGYKGGDIQQQINQDRAFISSPYTTGDSNTSTMTLMGVMDGHGNKGELVSSYTVDQLPHKLSHKLASIEVATPLQEQKEIEQALIECFCEIDKALPTEGSGGCSASVVFRKNNKIYIANAGDSRSFLVTCNPLDADNLIHIIYASREDKPDLPDEKSRIEKSGGKVYIPKQGSDESSRVLHTNPKTGITTGLAMSRSIGDWDAKTVGVIADPIVDVISLDEYTQSNHKLFAICVTDGMLDFLSPHIIATRVAQTLYQNKKNILKDHPILAAEELVLAAANGWTKSFGNRYRDDITIAFADISLHSD